jgi:hypothetical protein
MLKLVTNDEEHRDFHVELGARVRDLMFRRGRMSQTALAPLLGLQQSALSKKLAGQRGWDPEEILAISGIFDVPIAQLYGELDDWTPDPDGSAGGWAPWGSNPRPMGRRSTRHLHTVEPLAA